MIGNNMFQQQNMFDPTHLLDMTHNNNPPEDEDVDVLRDDEHETRSAGNDVTEVPSGDDQDPNQRPRKKPYHRHTQQQIQELENFFKECPHPDDKQRKELGQRLSLAPLQVKFWFQNKRTQLKAQHERLENSELRAEAEKLRAEVMMYKEALANVTCPTCNGPAALGEMSFDNHRVGMQNVSLRGEIDRISGISPKYAGGSNPRIPYPQGVARRLDLGVGNFGAPQTSLVGEMYGTGGLLRSLSGPTDADKPLIIELAVAAMGELVTMAQAGPPLWMPNPNSSIEILNEKEYLRTFPRGIGRRPLGMKSEASRDSAVVIMNHTSLVEILMDVDQWISVFPGIVSGAMTLEVLSTGVAGNFNGALQVMTAEFQVPSPLVPTRENYFVRYCKQHPDGTWAVVDVSLDNLCPSTTGRCRRRPSGCLIQELPNGYSKVIWVEHVEVDDRAFNNLYGPLVDSGLGFGAKRWVATLDRQCERLASALANNITAGEVGLITTPEGRKSMLKLSERMVMSFCTGVGASTAHTWKTISGSSDDDVRVMTRKSLDEPGRPAGIVLSAATSFWLPVAPKTVFDFLRDVHSRNEWDILSNGGIVQEMVHIANGRDPGNSVSLLRVNSANSSQSNMLILQESSTDATGSYVIYAPVDIVSMNVVLSGGVNPDYVALLPSGFAILPDGPTNHGGIHEVGSGGSLITVAFQILVDSIPTARLSHGSVATVNSLIKCTVERIRSAVAGNENEGL